MSSSNEERVKAIKYLIRDLGIADKKQRNLRNFSKNLIRAYVHIERYEEKIKEEKNNANRS